MWGRDRKRAKLMNDEPGFMDPELWKDLQYHVPLDTIFAKLPLREFFRLRLICKQWNDLAADRKFLEASNPRPIPKPHFYLCRRGPDYQLHGLLTYTSWSKEWSYMCLGRHDELDSMVENQGLVYSPRSDDNSVLRVFNIHSRVWYTLPPLPPQVSSHHLPVVALKADTSSHPYQFQVIRAGGRGITSTAQSATHTYDSRTNAWRVSSLTNITDTPYKATCAQANDAVYVWSDLDYVYCYKTKEDRWYTVDFPDEDHTFENWLCGVGAWKDRVYHMSQVQLGEYPHTWFEIIMSVWEERKLKWVESDRMPDHLRNWLSDSPHYCEEILTSYCDELVLVWSYCCEEGVANKFVIYNLETREWEIPDVPDGLVQPFMDDDESESFSPGSCCYHRKKGRYWATDEGTDESSDTDGEDRNQQPATLDEWSEFLDQL